MEIPAVTAQALKDYDQRLRLRPSVDLPEYCGAGDFVAEGVSGRSA